MQQIYPNPELDPGLRLDLDGRASFHHKGFVVEVHVRHATKDDSWIIYTADIDRDDVVMTATVTLCSVELAATSQSANLSDGYYLVKEILAAILNDTVAKARRKVERLNTAIATIDRAPKANTSPR